MKKCIVILLLLFCLTSVAYAHPGRTDEYGGHTETATGEYHYHHGYSAHSHVGGCPYNYDDQTGANSGKPSSTKEEKVPFWAYALGGAFAFCVWGVLPIMLEDRPKKGKNSREEINKSLPAPPDQDVCYTISPRAQYVFLHALKPARKYKWNVCFPANVRLISTVPIPMDSPFFIKAEFTPSARIEFGFQQWKLDAEELVPIYKEY